MLASLRRLRSRSCGTRQSAGAFRANLTKNRLPSGTASGRNQLRTRVQKVRKISRQLTKSVEPNEASLRDRRVCSRVACVLYPSGSSATALAAVLVNSLPREHHMSHLRGHDFAGGHLGMPLRFYISWSPVAAVPDLPKSAAHGPLLFLRNHADLASAMRLTPRCMDMLKLLSAARWLRTRQLRRRFFAGSSANAAQKRLRALVAGNYVRRL